MQAPTHSYCMSATYYSLFSGSRIMSRNKPLGRENTRLTITIDKTNAMRVCLQRGEEVAQIPNASVQGIPKSLSATQLDRYLADTYVVIAQIIGGGDLFVHVHHRLSGGMRRRVPDKVSREEYSEKKKLLCEHLRRLANPFVKCKVRDLLKEFRKFPDGLTGLPIGKGMLPEDTFNCLRAYNAALTGCSAIRGNNEKIRSDVDEFLTSFSEERTIWKELEFFLELPFIMQLQNKEIVDLLKRVEAGEDIADRTIELLEYSTSNFDIDELDSEINRLWCEKFPRDHDEDRSEADEYTLRTLTGQIFECAPEEERFSEMVRRGDPTNFIGKNLIIQNCWEGSGLITDAQPDQKGNYLFTLAMRDAGRGCRVRANLDGSIEAIQTVEYRLFDAILHGFIEEGERCEILEKGKSFFGLLTVGKREDYQARAVVKYLPGTTSSYVEVPFYKGDQLMCSVRLEDSKLKILRPGRHAITFSADGGYTNCRYKLIKQKVTPVEGITKNSIDTMVCVRAPDVDDNQRQWEIRCEINKMLEELRQLLLHDQKTLQSIVDSWICHDLKGVDLSLVENISSFNDKLVHLSQLYSEIGASRDKMDMIIQITQEANYARFVTKKSGISTIRLMKLLGKSRRCWSEMIDQDAVLFMGNTGAGKSTLVGFLQGNRLSRDINAVGQAIYKYKEADEENESLDYQSRPRIGQSLGASETIYPQGFAVKDKPKFMLVDFPGLHDTRGVDYQVCSSLSVDQAVHAVRSIRAIVLVVPFETFLADRGNRLIQLFHELEDRFPSIMNPESEDKECLHVAVTRSGDIKSSVMKKKMRDGSLIQARLNEINQQLKSLSEEGLESDTIDTQLAACRYQEKVWMLLQAMLSHKTLHIVNLDNNMQRKTLVNAFSSGSGNGVVKKHYRPAMRSDGVQKQFADCIVSYAYSWRRELLGRYLDDLPREIEQLKAEVDMVENQQKLREQCWELKIASMESEISSLMQTVEELEKLKSQDQLIGQTIDETIRASIVELVNTSDVMKSRQVPRDDLEIRVDQEVRNLKGIENTISDVTATIKQHEMNIEALRVHIRGLAEGSTRIVLWSSEDDFKQCVGLSESENFKGQLSHTIRLSLPYTLEGDKLNLAEKVLNLYAKAMFFPLTEPLRAEAKGEKFKLVKSSLALRHVRHTFRTTWNGEKPLPWIRILSRVPNTQYNAAQIENLRVEIQELMTDTERLNGIVKTCQENYRQIDKQCSLARVDIEKFDQRTEELKEQCAKEGLGQLIELRKQDIERSKEELAQINEDWNTWKRDEGPSFQRELRDVNKKLEECETLRRDLGVAIRTNIESTTLLRRFAEQITTTRNSEEASETSLTSNLVSDNIYEECKRFLKECTEDKLAEFWPNSDEGT